MKFKADSFDSDWFFEVGLFRTFSGGRENYWLCKINGIAGENATKEKRKIKADRSRLMRIDFVLS
jgi:hypothetical protein